MTVVSGCDPGWGIAGTVSISDESLAGHTLVVVVFPEAELDDAGLPVSVGIAGPGMGLATRAAVGETAFRFGKIGCNDAAYVLAWVDVDESEGLDALVAEKDFDGGEEQTEDHARIREARPGPGDVFVVDGPYAFSHDGALCDPDHADVALLL
ncbi:MAG: hypothetical protein JNK04_24065 [Myxococcales bacterium]|nr:hypothetical protein [Myxococcales bacterium]